MKIFSIVVAALILSACARPPRLDISMSVEKQSADLIFVKVKVANTENHATVPIALELTGQAENDGHWDKPATLLHPAAFVLNKKEQREITKFWRVPAQAARTTLTVKEQESGNLLKTLRTEKVFGSDAAPAAPTAKP